MLASVFSMARGLPDKGVVEGFNGKKVFGQGEINGISCTLAFFVNDKQLAIKSSWPSIGLILNIGDLEVFKVKALIGHRVKITSSDSYVNHMFYQLVVSQRVAKKLYQLSNGSFPFDHV